ncbi:MAG TPA: hypothetical protein VF407_24440 [Polyangiaceae bacterium]
MKRVMFGAALFVLSLSAGSSFAQERVALAGDAAKPARKVAAGPAPSAPAPKAKAPAAPKSKDAAAAGDGTTLVAPTEQAVVDSPVGGDLADVRGNDKSVAASGTVERTVSMTVTAAEVQRAMATPRLLRRINADRVLPKLAELVQACYQREPGEKSADVAVVRVGIDGSGAPDFAQVESGAVATPAVSACIASVAATVKFNAPGGIGTIVLVQTKVR